MFKIPPWGGISSQGTAIIGFPSFIAPMPGFSDWNYTTIGDYPISFMSTADTQWHRSTG
ncbi:MAG: hypothetical protein AB1847_02030 [bacterium]